MSEDTTFPVHEPGAELRKLDRLVGTWKLSGEAVGTVRFEWMEGGFFLLQHVDIAQGGQRHRGLEVIGHERPFGAGPSEEIKSRFYDDAGNTLDYVYKFDGDTLVIWGGQKGSPAYCRSEFSEDGNTMTAGWVYPGGGYQATGTSGVVQDRAPAEPAAFGQLVDGLHVLAG